MGTGKGWQDANIRVLSNGGITVSAFFFGWIAGYDLPAGCDISEMYSFSDNWPFLSRPLNLSLLINVTCMAVN